LVKITVSKIDFCIRGVTVCEVLIILGRKQQVPKGTDSHVKNGMRNDSLFLIKKKRGTEQILFMKEKVLFFFIPFKMGINFLYTTTAVNISSNQSFELTRLKRLKYILSNNLCKFKFNLNNFLKSYSFMTHYDKNKKITI